MSGKNDIVDYMSMIADAAEENRTERNRGTVMPEPAGEKAVDYLAVSKAWTEVRCRMFGRKNEEGNC